MRILVLTQIVPYPPDSGPKIKTLNVLRYLRQHHELHLVSFTRSAQEVQSAQALGELCASVTTVRLQRSRRRDASCLMRSLIQRRPFLIERDASAAMHDAIRRCLDADDFDAVHADQLSMAQFAIDLPVPMRVLDEHNAVWTIVRRAARNELRRFSRFLAELEWRKLRRYEGEVCSRFDWVTTVSETDRQALQAAAGGAFPTGVIPIAVDTHELTFAARSAQARDVLSVATMFYPPNAHAIAWFATEAFPIVRSAYPETRFYVVGSRPTRQVTRLATPVSGVEVTGYVADLAPLLERSAVLVVPVSAGSGMRVKILEAFARGVPVVSTSVGVEGIDAAAGTHLLVADRAPDFAAAIIRLLENPNEAARLARAARELVERRYDWRQALAGLDLIYPRSHPIGRLPGRELPSERAAFATHTAADG